MPTLRKARRQDLEPLTSLLKLLFTIEADFGFDAARQHRGLSQMLENDRGCILVAEEAGQVIGMCTGQVVISTAEGGPAVLVEDVVVEPGYRGRGVGRELMAAMAGWGLEQGATRLQLLADKNNFSALSFYERIGWRMTALVCLRQQG